MVRPDLEVLVIGAGPAGLSAAMVLDRHGVDYLLVDRSPVPGRDKPCGGFVPARVFSEADIPVPPTAHPIDRVRMKFPGMELVEVEFDSPIGVDMRREDLARAFLERIPGADRNVETGVRVRRLTIDGTGCKAILGRGDETEVVTAELVIDASGVNAVALRCGLVRERVPTDRMGYAVQYILGSPEGQTPRHSVDFFYGHEFSPSGYAWVFPRESEVVVGTGGLVSRVREERADMYGYLAHLLHDTEPVRSEYGNAPVLGREAALVPLAGVVTPSFADRVLLAGDAACHCSPITGEGIYYSMVGGTVAGEGAVRALSHGNTRAAGLRWYETKWKAMMGSDLKWGLWLQRRLLSSGSSTVGDAIVRSPSHLRAVAEMLTGQRGVLRTLLRIAPAYLRARLRR